MAKSRNNGAKTPPTGGALVTTTVARGAAPVPEEVDPAPSPRVRGLEAVRARHQSAGDAALNSHTNHHHQETYNQVLGHEELLLGPVVPVET